MANFRIHHNDCTRDIQYSIARRDGITETVFFEQLLLCAAWRIAGPDTILHEGKTYWFCDPSGNISLSKSGHNQRKFVAYAGPFPDPIRKISVKELKSTCAYTLTKRAEKILDLMKVADCNLSGYIRSQIRSLAPAQKPQTGIGWRFTINDSPYFHADTLGKSDFSFIPPPVVFFA